jgi:hypothetical protein
MDIEVHLRGANSFFASGRAWNLSMNGLFISCDELPEIGDLVDVTLFANGPMSSLHLDISGMIVRKNEAGVGIKFQGLSLDAKLFLKSLVEYNSPDDEPVTLQVRKGGATEAAA